MGAVSLVDTPDHVIPITTTAGTFRVFPGTEVTLDAEATAQHHVAGWKDENQNDLATATYSNYAVTTPSNMFPRTSALTFTVTGDTTAMAMFGINSYDVTASVATTTDVRGTVRIAYTDVQGAAQVSDSLATVTASAQGGSTATLTAYPAWGYHFVKWQNQNGDSLSAQNPLSVTSAVDTTLVAVFDTTKAELAWSAEGFTGYTMIDFNAYKPTLTNSHNVEVRYGCVESGLIVNAENGTVGVSVAYGNIAPTTGTYHIYAVHDLSQEYFYDSVAYTLTVEQGVAVRLQKNIATGGNIRFADQDRLPTLTHHYATNTSLPLAFIAHGHTVDVVATPAEGYHFTAWQDGDNVNGWNNVTTDTAYTFTVPTATAAGLKAVFDTNTYALKVTSADAAMGSGNGSTTAKHFLHYEISATPNTGYHFWQWDDDSIANPRTVTLISDSAFTASFAPDTFTITYMDGDVELKVDTFYYLQPITEYTLSREKWRFDGWNPVVPQLMPAENMTVYAQWYRICDSLQDYDGNEYASVNISNKCWMTENLRTRHYFDGRLIANIYEYQTILNPTVPQNYGLLYGWEDAVDANKPATRAASSVSPTYIQGVCPTGWHIPTADEAAVLINLPTVALCSTDGWITPNGNTNSTNFSAYPAGLYNAVLDRFEGFGTEADWWIVNGASNNTQNYSSLQIPYFCNTPQIVNRNPDDAVSVRCVLND